MMQDDRGEIENLMARYCELFDSGDLDGYAALFAGARIASHMSDTSGPEEVKAFHQANGIFYEGVPNTRHVISNLHIEIDDDGLTASGRSYVTVFQAVPDFPLQPVFIGQYQDKFKKVDGKWRFAERECEPYLAGDLSRHAREYPPPGPVRLP
jgi:3-phenylpropionate/cinnamic acid dioxygenase small subunit